MRLKPADLAISELALVISKVSPLLPSLPPDMPAVIRPKNPNLASRMRSELSGSGNPRPVTNCALLLGLMGEICRVTLI
ncbi:hypothetical protein AFLA_002171 [Aspergillus flavus NRRL3357]|nr:hypothetical protein AFLA_002171 [Aspergillus flavus NRRL3357]